MGNASYKENKVNGLISTKGNSIYKGKSKQMLIRIIIMEETT